MTTKNKAKSIPDISLEIVADQDELESEQGGIAANERSKLKEEEPSYGGVSFDADERKEYSQQQIDEKNLENEIKYEIERKNWEVAYEKLKELAKLNQANPVPIELFFFNR